MEQLDRIMNAYAESCKGNQDKDLRKLRAQVYVSASKIPRSLVAMWAVCALLCMVILPLEFRGQSLSDFSSAVLVAYQAPPNDYFESDSSNGTFPYQTVKSALRSHPQTVGFFKNLPLPKVRCTDISAVQYTSDLDVVGIQIHLKVNRNSIGDISACYISAAYSIQELSDYKRLPESCQWEEIAVDYRLSERQCQLYFIQEGRYCCMDISLQAPLDIQTILNIVF